MRDASTEPRPLTVLLWDVHGPWTRAFVQGGHRYRVIDSPTDDLGDVDPDIVVLQRPREIELAEELLDRRPGRDLPALYVEHETPREHAALSRHPLADRTDIPLVHITDFNRLMWDNGRCPTHVVPHGVIDPGYRYLGALPRAATIVNDPVGRWRIAGADLLAGLGDAAPIDVYGTGTERLHHRLGRDEDTVTGHGDLEQSRLHDELALRRVFVHTPRWTSLGVSVIEAMYLGMPIVAVGTTEASAGVPAEAGVVSTDPDILAEAVRQFVHEPLFAELTGKAARHWAQANFALSDFLRRWDRLLRDRAS
ncbi:glycosyltransferase [Nocardia sp. CC227C]|uniref:glycosyltransferase n=1 Tax=Nocardia sp. CC227C TaxID=3044562 RepID=UPI00278C2754|nr:glycosyltransferase [Nocardia sp. CC227C]